MQFHLELKSRLGKAHPLFREFVRAASEYHDNPAQPELDLESEPVVKSELLDELNLRQ